jgi:nucleotide-binding universal stress UspA family protein
VKRPSVERSLNTMYSHVVIPVDGSPEATRAASRGLALAAAFDATVDVLSVVERSALRLARGGDETERLRERGDTILEEITELAAERDQSVRTERRDGKPAAEICAFAAERDADLIVLGRQGMTGLGKRLLGGVTEHVLHRSDVPVFVVPGADEASGSVSAEDPGYDRILLPTDGSENAGVATPHGAALAQRYDAVVHVLNVVDLQEAGGMFSAGGLEQSFVDRLEKRGRGVAEGVETELRTTAPALDVETAVVRTASFGGAAVGIEEYVTDQEIDLVVMGSHGRSNLRRQVLGSVASTVLRTVDVPVLVVKRPS